MTLIDLISSIAHILLISSVAFGQIVIKEDRRRLTSNADSCDEIDYGTDVDQCIPFYDTLMFWNEEFVSKICYGDGNTDKSITAKLCPGE